MKKKILFFIVTLVYVVTIPLMSFSHSGRTDGNGGHKDNKNKSGLGSYHYHCGGHPPHLHSNGVCPYDNSVSSSSSNSSSGSSKSSSNYSSSNSSASSSSSSTSKSTPVVPAVVYARRIDAINIPSSLYPGDSVQLSASVYPSNAQDNIITWSSETPSIATISSSGELTAKDVGTAVIRAETSQGTTSTFTITIKEILATSIEIENKSKSILIGDTLLLKVILTPSNSTNKDISWKSSDEEVATVSSNGTLFAKKVGTATISAIHNNLHDSFEIKVDSIEAQNIKIQPIDTPKEGIKSDSEIQLRATITPSNTTDKSIKWAVNDDNIATIDKSGKLKFKNNGIVTVTAETSNGLKSTVEIEATSDILPVVGGGIIATSAIASFAVLRKRKNRHDDES